MSLAVKNLDYEIGNERILDQISLRVGHLIKQA